MVISPLTKFILTQNISFTFSNSVKAFHVPVAHPRCRVEFFKKALNFSLAKRIAASSDVQLVSTREVASKIQESKVLWLPCKFLNCGSGIVPFPDPRASSNAVIPRDL